MNPSSQRPPSRNIFDQYLGQSSSYKGKHFENADDFVAWLYQHAQLLQNGQNDPVMMFCNDSSDSMALLTSGRSTELPLFDPDVDDFISTTMLHGDQNLNSHLHSECELLCDKILDFNIDFGLVEIANEMPITPSNLPYDSDRLPSSPSMKKNRKKKQRRVPSNLPHTNAREWNVMDDGTGKLRKPYLHEFLRHLLDNPNYSYIASYVDRNKGTFKFYEKNTAAELWQRVKGRNSDSVMTYEKLARAIRYYYSSGIIRPSPGRFTFQFGSGSNF